MAVEAAKWELVALGGQAAKDASLTMNQVLAWSGENGMLEWKRHADDATSVHAWVRIRISSQV
jgi:hypothetical protein